MNVGPAAASHERTAEAPDCLSGGRFCSMMMPHRRGCSTQPPARRYPRCPLPLSDMPPLSRHLQRRRLSKIRGYVRGAVLDLGCGDASLRAWLDPNQTYTGVEIRADVVRDFQQSGLPHRFIAADLDVDDLTLEPGAYDTIVMSAIIEHLRTPARALAGLPRFLAPGGRLVITTPTRLGDVVHRLGAVIGLFSREAEKEHQRIFDRGSLERLLRECGFVAERYETFDLGLNQLCVAVPEARRAEQGRPP